MIRYEIAHPGEEEKLVDFGNYVFSQSARPHDFRAMLPKVYGKGVKNADIHFVAHDEKDNIRAMVACLPLDMEIAGEKVPVGTVGTVSVHPYARGEGHMKHVMKLMQDTAREKGMAALVLGGRRQRYNYFGYEHAGANIVFSLNLDNCRHALAGVDASSISFSEVKDGDEEALTRCFELYQSGPVRGARPRERYLDYMRSWTGTLLEIKKDGEFAGALQESGSIGELLLKDEKDLPAVILKWFGRHPEIKQTSLTVWPYEHERISILENIAEGMSIASCQMLHVLNFTKVVRALMKLNALAKPLHDGAIVLKVEDETFRVSVQNGVPACEATDQAPDLTLTALEAERLLFLPTRYLIPGPEKMQNWLPLPWVMPSPDHF